MTSYNISLMNNVTNGADILGVLNYHTYDLSVIFFLLAMIIVFTVLAIRAGLSANKAILVSLAGTFVPTLLFRIITFLDKPLVSDWFVITHIALLVIFAIIVYNEV